VDVRWLVGVFVLASTACATPAPNERGDGAERPSAPTSSPTTLIDHEVAWPSEAIRDDLVSQLGDEARLAVARSTVPVLMVDDAALLSAAIVMSKPRWTAISAAADGITLSLSATRSAHRYPHIGPAEGKDRVRDHAAFVTQNEQIWSASWIEGGVAYAIEVECSSLPDPRCADDAYLRKLTARLGYLGGEGAR
jgi:hypothetical protein